MQQQLQQQQLQQQMPREAKVEPHHEVEESANNSEHSTQHMCPYCNYISNSEMRIQAHVLAQHGQGEPSPPAQATSPAKEFMCPLCQDGFRERCQLERHVMQIHSVNSEGLQRLLLLVDQSHWLNAVNRSPASSTPQAQQQHHHSQHQTPPHPHLNHNQMISPSSSAGSSKELDSSGGKQNHSDANSTEDREDNPLLSPSPDDQVDVDENRCQACFKNFRNIDDLCAHHNETGHLEIKQTPAGPGYLCWKKGCNQYFQSAHSLQAHFREVHSPRVGSAPQQGIAVSEKHVYKYRCNQCSLAFKTMEKLQLHSQYHLIRDATKCVLCGRSFRSVVALHKHVETSHSELSEEELAAYKQSLMNNPLLLAGLSGQVLDPSTNELLRKESLKMEADDLLDTDESPMKDHHHEDGIGNAHSGDGDNSDDSVVYKEQQFLEDYLNSQAIAEDNYNDPNRKYKCHRCKVAFTRQSYLTSHNKTLLHRKGEKLSYPMEKYLDPNRPYKCDVCKESFTQKNILLVHYNSVSHLHKLKRAMQEQQNNNNNNNNNNAVTAVSPSSAAAALAASLGVTPPPTPKSGVISDEDDKKPYKCNICKVAYSQGSTLDIHMRSVLHQTRASKLQDLAMSGQIDLSKPLIEQPEPQKAQDQHKRMLQDMMGSSPKQSVTSPPSGINSSSTTLQVPSLAQGSPPVTGSHIVPQTSSAAPVVPSPLSIPTMTSVPSSITPNSSAVQQTVQASPVMASSPPQHGMVSCQRCSALFASQEQLTTHQQLYCLFGSPINLFPPLTGHLSTPSHPSPQPPGLNKTPPPLSTTPHLQDDSFQRLTMPNKKSSQVYKHLLESYGFDLVMQFNENHQRRQRKEREDDDLPPLTPTTQTPVPDEEVDGPVEDETAEQDLPEVAKSVCQHCRKEFSSVWVLKAHCEEVHRDLVPLEFLEKYAQQIKSEYEKKGVSMAPPSGTPTPVTQPEISQEKELQEDNKEALHAKIGLTHQHPPQQQQHQQQQSQVGSHQAPDTTPPAPSTPTASSTPASSTDSIPATLSTPMGSAGAPSLSLSLAQQMNEMQAALNAMAASQLQQQLQQFNPMMMGLGMGLPLGLNMNALAAMNLQPPLVPMMMPPPPFDHLSLAQVQNPLFSPQAAAMDPAGLLAKQQQHLLQQQQQAVSAAQQKRARTRITDDQLKILRAHFDINNSPSEEQIHDMAGQSGLPPKVIKHWFRNTLFKERQRNKDSPYNFNNPPSTTLNLEEYEKTGEAKVMPLNTSSSSSNNEEHNTSQNKEIPPRPPSTPSSSNKRKQSQPQSFSQPHTYTQLPEIKTEPRESLHTQAPETHEHKFNNIFHDQDHRKDTNDMADEKPQNLHPPPSPMSNMTISTNSTHHNTENNSLPRSSSPGTLTLTSIIATQLGPDSVTTSHANISPMTSVHSNMLPPKLTPPNFTSPNHVPTSPNIMPVTPTSRSVSPGRSYNNNSSDGFTHSGLAGGCLSGGGNSNGSNSSTGSSGKRANRTRFTDYQIKVLQEFFENNAYPKDDDLEYLSKLLSLSPRVIVVWFQNARQKARKVYENQPPVETPPGVDETGANRFQRTPGLNYQCKKCLLVFQRYYELIRHQKTHCFKEEDAKRSAQAQAAAAQIAAVLSSEDSNSSTITEQNQQQVQQQTQQAQQQQQQQQPQSSPVQQQPPSNLLPVSSASSNPTTPSGPITPTPPASLFPPSPVSTTPTPAESSNAKEGTFQCDKCNLVFPRFDLWREHQLVHIMNPNLFPTYPPDSPFGILQQHAQLQQQQQQQQQQHHHQQHFVTMGVADLSMNASGTPPHQHPLASMLSGGKRKFDDLDESLDRDCDQPKDKRLRTTILPEQLDYLYQKYQIESNPSRKMLENIAREVGLKKRVVQVWFQNTRARERKGQFRAHAQVINKRCPFCPALFKVKSALESHLVTKHADQCTRGEINIDALPDEELSMESTPSFSSQIGESIGKATTNFASSNSAPNMMPPLFPPFHGDVENSLKKYYEESMKRYLSEIQAHHASQNGGMNKESVHIPTDLSMKIKQEPTLAVSEESGGGGGGTGGDGPLDLSKPVDLSRPMKVSMDHEMRQMMPEQGPLTDLSERSICFEDDSASETTENMDGDESNPTSPASSTQSGQQRHGTSGSGGSKRFRTQMSSLQVRVMKSLFSDYKTPTMAECEMLGREIGLPKRVVQVWFQNARAKEKKNKLALQKVLGSPESNQDGSRPPEECKLCQFKYSHKYSIQDHIFTKKHIDTVKVHIESGKADMTGNNSDGGGSGGGEFTVPPTPSSSGDTNITTTVPPAQHSPQYSPTNNNQQQLAQLQMLQMAAASGLGLSAQAQAQAQAMAAAAAASVKMEKEPQHGSKSPAPGGVPGPEDMALLHQLYGLGLAGFPGAGNLFLHPAMFTAAGKCLLLLITHLTLSSCFTHKLLCIPFKVTSSTN
ncbi:hypothetical protein PR048_002332 [Dryococelus australis]|uniref:Zinc finger homeobox protein 4 n=1 Tax=Dryococelus australis TaxID=614101 RepID=A0ABQ9IJW4_9NEOP|nr:hypothetical protein PR048_002332 [Dryococelus australis]